MDDLFKKLENNFKACTAFITKGKKIVNLRSQLKEIVQTICYFKTKLKPNLKIITDKLIFQNQYREIYVTKNNRNKNNLKGENKKIKLKRAKKRMIY